jgi:hypothetical protein
VDSGAREQDRAVQISFSAGRLRNVCLNSVCERMKRAPGMLRDLIPGVLDRRFVTAVEIQRSRLRRNDRGMRYNLGTAGSQVHRDTKSIFWVVQFAVRVHAFFALGLLIAKPLQQTSARVALLLGGDRVLAILNRFVFGQTSLALAGLPAQRVASHRRESIGRHQDAGEAKDSDQPTQPSCLGPRRSGNETNE